MADSTYSKLRNGVKKLPFYLQNISDIDISYDDIIEKNSVGYSKKETNDEYDELDEGRFGSTLSGLKNKKFSRLETPYFLDNWEERRDKLRILATYPEMEYVLHQIANEAVTYDDDNYFCKLRVSSEYKEDISSSIQKSFKKIYQLWGFSDGSTAWEYFLEWLTEGFKAYEIVYDDIQKPTEVSGFIEYEPATLVPVKRRDDKNKIIKTWLQKPMAVQGSGMAQQSRSEKTIPDESLVFIAFNRTAGNYGTVSHIERMERSFNIMRSLEDSKVGWIIMNSQFRMKIIIPVGTRSTSQAKEALGKVATRYKEDLYIDHKTGELQVNGEPRINYSKPIILPSRQGQEPIVDGVKYDGPDLSGTEINEYAERRFYRDSGLPWSRFDRESGAGSNILFEASGVPYDEISFYKMVKRFRKEFGQLLMKPTIMDVYLNHPELKEDKSFKSKIHLEFESDHLMTQARRQEVEGRNLDHINELRNLERADGTPQFALNFLLKEYWDWDSDKMKENEEALKKELGSPNEDGFFGDG